MASVTPTLDNPGTTVLSPAKLSHVVLRTNQFEKMSAFWSVFLNARHVFKNDMLNFITYDDEPHRIGLINMEGHIGPKNPLTSGLEHICFTYNTLTDLAMGYLQRQSHGILPKWCVNHGPSTSAYYQDPDGNTIEMAVDNMTIEEADEFSRSEAYRINPIGVDFVMEDLIERIKAGEDDRSLKTRPPSGPRTVESVPL